MNAIQSMRMDLQRVEIQIAREMAQTPDRRPQRKRGAVRCDWLPSGGGHSIPVAPESGEWLVRLTWQFAGGAA